MGCVESNTNASPAVSQKKEEQETPATPKESRWYNRHKFKGLDFEGRCQGLRKTMSLWQTARKTEQHGGITFTDAETSVTRDEVHKRDLEAAVALHEGAVPCTTTHTAC